MITQEDYFEKIQKEARMRKDKLIEKSAQVLLSLDIAGLNKKGVKRGKFIYEILNQYPPFYLTRDISEKEIFYNDNSSIREKKNEPLAIYVHLPFCKTKCSFCCYVSMPVTKKEIIIDNYISYLRKEIELLFKRKYIKSRKVSSIYWGGGTPSFLEEKQIDRLMGYLKDNFDIMDDAQITCETLLENEKKLECLRKNGFNRLSIGVQIFDNDLLKSYNRPQTVESTIKAFKLIRKLGFNHINIDLLFGLAGENIYNWKRSLDIAEELRPENVTTYPYITYPYLEPFSQTIMYKKSKDLLPTENERLLMHTMAIERFVDSGYIQICPYEFISSWEYPFGQHEFKAKNGEIYALGVTGHSFINNVDCHNPSSMSEYYRLLNEDRLPVFRGRKLNKKEQMIRFVVIGLQKTSGINREDGGVDKILFKQRYRISFEKVFEDTLKILRDLDLIIESDRYIRLSYRGLLYHTETSIFFYLEKDRKKIVQLYKQGIGS